MANYTSSLPDSLLTQLSEMAQKLKVPKNQIIERALNKYLTEVERQLYIRSFKQLSGDKDILSMAEEGMEDYLMNLDEWDAKG
ncbi:MAG: ribbon-helix-helix protein, CopG family [Saprospiraceae bacterium]|nr:ribbon-helix-helix protein, CopG family [Saprospiraceae bacterium]MBP6567232.1 ribbon-helix-helix protein, CopG family [Saprospiraceae bacterium]